MTYKGDSRQQYLYSRKVLNENYTARSNHQTSKSAESSIF